jgi:hypothetical protein
MDEFQGTKFNRLAPKMGEVPNLFQMELDQVSRLKTCRYRR